ncbi:MAG: Ig-like domain-containing protein, partial [Gemmatimonadota bacterium]|nr:Ig-like domain-containing protein [Gemmatimonadota bacterium]
DLRDFLPGFRSPVLRLTATQLFDVTVADNQPPEPVGAIPDRTVAAGDEVSINVEPYFTDPDGDDLEYSAASSSEAVATVDLAGEGRLDVQGRARGEATVTVTATDPGGLAAAQEFEVEVPNRAPYVDREIEDLDAIAGRAYRALLTDVFVDPDGDPLDYAASSSDTGVAEPEVRGDTIFIAAAGVGTATVGVAATDAGGLSATEEFEVTVTASLFDLRLGRTSDVTDTLLSLIRQVGEEWEAILRDTELTDVEVPDTVTCLGIRALDVGEVDDHLVLLDVDEEDGVGGILAYAGYCYVRSSDGSPLISAVVFDEADVDTLLHYGSMEDVIFHEIAHGLGFISRYWDYKDLLDDGDDPHFEGDLAVEAFDDAGGDDYDGEKVPISSPDHSHWRKSVFGTEGMTPSLRLGVKNPFSAITLQAMADVDYEVDVSLADDYELPDNSAPPPGPPGDTARVLDLSNDVASTPVTVLGRDGRIIRVIRPPPGPGVVRNRLREARLEPGRFPDGPEEDATYRGPGRTTMWRLVRESASGRPR